MKKSLLLSILFIAFALAVGVVTMQLSKTTAQIQDQCSLTLNLKLVKINQQEEFCYDNVKKEIRFILENGVTTEIKALTIRINGAPVILNNLNIGKAATYLAHVPHSTSNINKIEIIPSIDFNKVRQECQKESIIRKKIPLCSKP